MHRWRHRGRGSTYDEVAHAHFQDSKFDVLDNATVVIYRNVDNGKLYAREITEFRDGRFEELPRPRPEAIELRRLCEDIRRLVQESTAHSMVSAPVATLVDHISAIARTIELRDQLAYDPSHVLCYPGVPEEWRVKPEDKNG